MIGLQGQKQRYLRLERDVGLQVQHTKSTQCSYSGLQVPDTILYTKILLSFYTNYPFELIPLNSLTTENQPIQLWYAKVDRVVILER